MARQAKIAGTCFIKVDGQQLSVKGGVEVPMTDKERKSVVTSSGVFFSEEKKAPYVKLTCVVPKDFPRKKVIESESLSVTAELANGQVYSLTGAWLANPAALKGDEGTTDLEFEGNKGEFV